MKRISDYSKWGWTIALIQIIFILLMFILFGCSDRIIPEVDPGRRLEVPFSVEGDMPLSRSEAALKHECLVDHAAVIFFSEDGSEYLTAVLADAQAGKFSFEIPDPILPDTPYSVLAVGNARMYVASGFDSFASYCQSEFSNLSISEVMARLEGCSDKPLMADTPGALPMWGKFIDARGQDSSFSYSKTDSGFEIRGNFYFSRSIVRIDVLNLVPDRLRLVYAKVCNYRTAGRLFADGVAVGDVKGISRPSPSPAGDASDGYAPIQSVANPTENNTQSLRGALYAFPNVVNTSSQNDKLTTGLILVGFYTDPETGVEDSDPSYYRFNLANVGDAQVLNRNYVYRAVIKGVKRRGALDDFAAYSDAQPIFEYNVDNVWDATDDNYVSDEKGNFIVVSRSHLTFSGEDSSADNVELRVSTSPKLRWRIEAVEEKGNQNDKFIWEKLSDEALKIGPVEANATDYVRYGYIRIVAENSQTGDVVSLPVYLQQLTTSFNVRTLTVDGATGTIDVEIPPMGGSVELPVATGSHSNLWAAIDEDNDLENWDKDASFTKTGSHGTELCISVPANITGATRTATIKVALTSDDPDVQPVYVRISQESSRQWFALSPQPDGDIRINAFSIEKGNPNGVPDGASRRFTVRLVNPAHRFKVETSFNQYRDMRLTHLNSLEHSNVQAVHEFGGATLPTLENLHGLSSGDGFFINAFRTGPGDQTIKGTITITVYDPDHEDEEGYYKQETFQVSIVSGSNYELGDVIIDNKLIADRNVGNKPRVQKDADNDPIPGEPFLVRDYHCSENHTFYRNGTDLPDNDEDFDDLSFRLGYSFQHLDALSEYWHRIHADEKKMYSPFYTSDTEWRLLKVSEKEWFINQIVFSKDRMFLVSDLPKLVNGKKIPVVCWLPTTLGGCSATGSKTFSSHPACYACVPDENEANTVFYAFYRSAYYNTTFGSSTSSYNYNSGATYGKPSMSVRLLHDLTDEEIESYKKNYLGY